MRSLIVAFFVTWVVVANAFADDIPVGNDSFTVKAADVNISLPADFFNPGSDPFTGNVMLGGGSGGGTDTIIQRKEPASPLPVPGADTVPIEMLQLDLRSVTPITVTYGGVSTEQWNVQAVLDPLKTSKGLMNISHSNPEGGTFNSFFDVWVELDFTPTLPVAPTRSLFFEDTLGGNNLSWTHTPPTGFPAGSYFYPGGVPGFPDQLNHLFYNGGQLDMELALAVPEPGTFVLLVCGLAASVLFFFCRRQLSVKIPIS